MKLRSFLVLIMIVTVLSIGLISASGCSATVSQGTPVIQPTLAPLVTQTIPEPLVTQPTTASLNTQTTAGPLVTQPAPDPLVAQPAPGSPVTQPTPETPVTQPTAVTTTGSFSTIQQALLADIRSTAEQPKPGIYYVDAVTAKKLVDETQATFLDARYLVDYDAAHISGAVSLPVSSIWTREIEPEKILLDKEAVLIAYCAPGCPAGLELAQELSIRGYQNLFVLNGGYLVWEDAGYPMAKQN